MSRIGSFVARRRTPAATLATLHPGHPPPPRRRPPRGAARVPRRLTRRQLHAQLPFPPGALLIALVPRVAPRRRARRGGDERLALGGGHRDRRRPRDRVRPRLPFVPQLLARRRVAALHGGRRRRHDRPRGHEHGHRRAPPSHRRRPHPHRPPLLAGRRPDRLRLDRPERLLQRLHPPLRRRRLDRAGSLGHVRQFLRPRPAVLRLLGHAHLPRVAAERRGTADRLQPRRRTRQRQRLPRSRPGRRHRGPPARPRRADPLPHPATRFVRRPALRLLLDRGRRGPVPEPVRPAHDRWRAVQADLLRPRRLPPALVAGRGVDRLRGQRRRAGCRGRADRGGRADRRGRAGRGRRAGRRGRAATPDRSPAAVPAGGQRRQTAARRHHRTALGAADGHPRRDHRRPRRASRWPAGST